ncbi:MAG: DUF4097 family beta strand repeat protein [Fibrella sp.]|nr:DUF4097 family beta strand repeat protein [Armatimonadota bacterium]
MSGNEPISVIVDDGGITLNGKTIETNSSHIFIHDSHSEAKDERIVTRTVDATSVRTVTVRTDFGAIAVEPSTGSARIGVAATITLGENNLSSADQTKYLSGFTIPDTVDGDNYTARVVPPADLPDEVRWNVSYRVTVPPSVALDLKSENGSVVVRDTKTIGKILARSEFGAITVANAGTTVDAQTENGSVTIESKEKRDSVLARSQFGAISVSGPARTVDVKTENGAVSIDGAANAEKVTARSSFGAINLEKVGGTVDAQTENGAVHYSGTPKALTLQSEFGAIAAELYDCATLKDATLKTTNGSVTVILPASASVNITGDTGNGKIDTSGFPANITGDSFKKSVKASLNGGKAPMSLSTEFGSLTITARQ